LCSCCTLEPLCDINPAGQSVPELNLRFARFLEAAMLFGNENDESLAFQRFVKSKSHWVDDAQGGCSRTSVIHSWSARLPAFCNAPPKEWGEPVGPEFLAPAVASFCAYVRENGRRVSCLGVLRTL